MRPQLALSARVLDAIGRSRFHPEVRGAGSRGISGFPRGTHRHPQRAQYPDRARAPPLQGRSQRTIGNRAGLTVEKSEAALLMEHDLTRKPVPTPGSSPGAGFFGIML